MSELTNYLTNIANAIRTQKGTSAVIPAQNFSSEILNISGVTGMINPVNSFTISGTYATTTYYDSAMSGYAVTPDGDVIIYIKTASTSYENIYFNASSVLSGITVEDSISTGWDTSNSVHINACRLTGIANKINITVNLSAVNSTDDYVQADLTVTSAGALPTIMPAARILNGYLKKTLTTADCEYIMKNISDKSLQYTFYNQKQITTPPTIPSNITGLSTYCFYGCTGMKGTMTIPSNVTTGSQAFTGCTGLTKFVFNCPTIFQYACQNCTGVTSVTISSNVTSIASRVFHGCTNLTSITIPSSVTTINANAFTSSSLTNITINKTADSITGSPWGAPEGCTVTWNG